MCFMSLCGFVAVYWQSGIVAVAFNIESGCGVMYDNNYNKRL